MKKPMLRINRTPDVEVRVNTRGLLPIHVRRLKSQIEAQLEPPPAPSVPGEIDAGIRQAVKRLQEAGIETYESCEGSNGHSYTEPTVAFYGDSRTGLRAVAVCLDYGLPVLSLRRTWDVLNSNELTGPHWEITFRRRML